VRRPAELGLLDRDLLDRHPEPLGLERLVLEPVAISKACSASPQAKRTSP
jgi:hypothetical protein